MIRKRFTSYILLTLFINCAIVQKGSTQDARTYLQQSLSAYGTWQSVRTVEYTISGSRDGGAQGKTYKSGEQQAYEAKRIYDLPAKRLYETNLNRFPGGYAFHFATTVQDTTAYNFDIDGTRGGRVYNTAGKAVAENRYKVVNNHIAYFKVLELYQSADSLEKADSLSYITIKRWNGQHALVGTYYFSRDANLLERVTANQPGQFIEMLFGDYKRRNGRMDNEQVQLYVNGKASYTEQVRVNATNFTFDANLLLLPEGYVLNKAQEPSKPIEIAKDVYLIERLAGDRNVLFVNMDDYITVIEAPVSAAVSKQVIQMIREVAPYKPIRYVFTTHFHSDHTGGLRQYVFEGAQLVMASAAQAYVKDLMTTTPPDDLTKSGRTTADMVTIDKKFVLEDANHRIEFYEVPNSHADGMSLAYFPKEKLIYQGDLLSVPLDGTLPYAIEVTQDMQRFLSQQGLEYKRIIGHHGYNNITPAMVQQVLKRKLPVASKR